jgi:hypothetical protein
MWSSLGEEMKVTVKHDKKTDEYYFDIHDFKDIIDISKVVSYKMDKEDGGFTIKFYDKNDKLIKPKQKKVLKEEPKDFVKSLAEYLVKEDQYLALNITQATTLAQIVNRFFSKKKLVTFIDPPSGWKYGFPKVIPSPFPKNFKAWLIKNGYPKKDVELALLLSRYWEEEV